MNFQISRSAGKVIKQEPKAYEKALKRIKKNGSLALNGYNNVKVKKAVLEGSWPNPLERNVNGVMKPLVAPKILTLDLLFSKTKLARLLGIGKKTQIEVASYLPSELLQNPDIYARVPGDELYKYDMMEAQIGTKLDKMF